MSMPMHTEMPFYTCTYLGGERSTGAGDGGPRQKLVDDKGIPKGMRAILEERGVDVKGMK